MKKYCDKCGQFVETRIIEKREIYNVNGEGIEVDAQVMACATCEDELFSEELDEATLLSAYNEYRRRHKLLLPEEIRDIRESYGLSQRSLAKLLGWGDKTICRYESGAIQDKAHNSMLLFLRNPDNMREYITDNEVALDKRQLDKLVSILEQRGSNEESQPCCTNNKSANLPETPCEENGFKSFDYEKFCAMVLFFASKSKVLLKTKLMKLLNYSDMIFYKENGISISGTRYVHLPYGPVPEAFEQHLSAMANDHIAHIQVSYKQSYELHKVVAECEMPEGILTESELAVMDRVYRKFASYGSKEISNYSHCERGYMETRQGDIISYAYAKDMELI